MHLEGFYYNFITWNAYNFNRTNNHNTNNKKKKKEKSFRFIGTHCVTFSVLIRSACIIIKVTIKNASMQHNILEWLKPYASCQLSTDKKVQKAIFMLYTLSSKNVVRTLSFFYSITGNAASTHKQFQISLTFLTQGVIHT